MARPSFKQWLKGALPQRCERSTYVLATGLVLYAIIAFWQPLEGSVWHIQDPAARIAIECVFFGGWAISLAATFMLNHLHLFGLKQTFTKGDIDAGMKEFRTPLFYRLVRHPIQTGVVVAMFATPDMTYTRAFLAAGMLAYVAIGLFFEERDLVSEFGDDYLSYKDQVPAVLPIKLR